MRARTLLAAGAILVVGLVLAARASAAETVLEGLRKGLKESDPKARAACVADIGKAATNLSADERRRVVLALRKALEGDPIPSVRIEVVRALSGLKDDAAWVPVIVAAVSEKDETVRAAATDAVLLGRSDLLSAAAKLLKEDQDPTFRAETALLLGRRRRVDAVPILLETLLDPHPRVSTAAGQALEAVSGKAFGWDAKAWGTWWEQEKARVLPAPSPHDTVTKEPEAPKVPPPPPPPRGLVPDLYGLPLTSKDFVFVVDVSGSIGASGFETAKAQMMRAVERLGSDVHFSALFFDETARVWHPEMILATPAAKAELDRFVRGIPRGHRTDIMTPLNAGLAIVRRRIEAKVAAKEGFVEPVTMIVVSDGQENVRATPGESVGDKLDMLDLTHAVVHAIVVGGRDNALMAALARRAGGRYVVVP